MNTKHIPVIVTMLLIGFINSGASAGDYIIDWSTIDGGGGTSSGGEFVITGTIGQHDAGTVMSSGSFNWTGGFWPGMQVPVCIVDFALICTRMKTTLLTHSI